MTAAPPPMENRQSYRFPASDAINGELILADGRQWPICIVDQSSSGFGILTDSLPPLNCGDLVELRTDSFSCETRIANMLSNDHGASDNDDSPQCRVGVVRVRDISIESDTPRPDEQQVRYRHFRPSMTLDAAAVFAIVVVLVVIAAVVIVAPSLTASAPHNEQVVSSAGAPHQPNTPSVPQQNKAESSPFELRHLPGALPFVTSGVVNELDLSDAQIERLRSIIRDTNDAIAKNEEMRRILGAARKDALDVLTRQQRKQWEHLSGAAN